MNIRITATPGPTDEFRLLNSAAGAFAFQNAVLDALRAAGVQPQHWSGSCLNDPFALEIHVHGTLNPTAASHLPKLSIAAVR